MSSALYSSINSGIGIECEYMLVNSETLEPSPMADTLLAELNGCFASEVELGKIRVSNESTLHQIEIKTNGPAAKFDEYLGEFQGGVRRLSEILSKHGSVMLPSGMHPFLDPNQVRFWECGGSQEIYKALGAVFNRRTHGWTNLQSIHLNFPYADDTEFRLLHSSIRALLPIIPGLAGSSPIVAGALTGLSDSRLHYYRVSRGAFKSLRPAMVPDVIPSVADYQRLVLDPAYEEIRSLCPSGVLCEPWINDAGAIARVDRGTIEIRIIDAQESPLCDIAVASLIRAALFYVSTLPLSEIEGLSTAVLDSMLVDSIKRGSAATVNKEFSEVLGAPPTLGSVGDLWAYLYSLTPVREAISEQFAQALGVVFEQGPLAHRLGRSFGENGMRGTYEALRAALISGRPFVL